MPDLNTVLPGTGIPITRIEAARRASAQTREQHRSGIADRLLTALEHLVERHRALALHGDQAGEHVGLHAELIAAEVAHELSVTRSALRTYPPLG